MKKLLLFMAILLAVTMVPLSVYADQHHDQQWKNNHSQQWKDHQGEWTDHDREWRDHRDDRAWREEHARLWPDWYQWHRDDESDLGIQFSTDGFDININL